MIGQLLPPLKKGPERLGYLASCTGRNPRGWAWAWGVFCLAVVLAVMLHCFTEGLQSQLQEFEVY